MASELQLALLASALGPQGASLLDSELIQGIRESHRHQPTIEDTEQEPRASDQRNLGAEHEKKKKKHRFPFLSYILREDSEHQPDGTPNYISLIGPCSQHAGQYCLVDQPWKGHMTWDILAKKIR